MYEGSRYLHSSVKSLSLMVITLITTGSSHSAYLGLAQGRNYIFVCTHIVLSLNFPCGKGERLIFLQS